MLCGHVDNPGTYEHFFTHPVWQQALQWIQGNVSAADGEYEIDGRNMYASVSTVATMPRQQGKYEAHVQYIDLHYCLEGGEIIEWAPVNTLGEPQEKNEEKDYALYAAPTKSTSILMTPGTFAIFFPEDAHMPKLTDGQNATVKKVVVKIHTALIK